MDLFTVLILGYFTALLLFGGVFMYFVFFSKQEHELEQNQKQLYKKSGKILKDAHKKAGSILRQTAEKASKMLAQSSYLNDEIHQDFDNTLQHIANQDLSHLGRENQSFMQDYHKSLEQIKQEYMEQLHEVVQQIKESSESEMQGYRDSLRQETIDAQQIVGQKINEEFEKSQREIQVYKQKQIDQIDKSIQSKVDDIAKKVFGKAISAELHEKLIIEALEEAKKKGVFSNDNLGWAD